VAIATEVMGSAIHLIESMSMKTNWMRPV